MAVQAIATIDGVEAMLAGQGYVSSRALSTVVFLALKLGRPLFLEGEAGVGKTEIAKAVAAALGRRLIRLQCYEGLDAGSAGGGWEFAAPMIALRGAEAGGGVVRFVGRGCDRQGRPVHRGIPDRAALAGCDAPATRWRARAADRRAGPCG